VLFFLADKPELYARETQNHWFNLQVITNQSGNIVFIFEPYVGSVHDLTALHETGNESAGCLGSGALNC